MVKTRRQSTIPEKTKHSPSLQFKSQIHKVSELPKEKTNVPYAVSISQTRSGKKYKTSSSNLVKYNKTHTSQSIKKVRYPISDVQSVKNSIDIKSKNVEHENPSILHEVNEKHTSKRIKTKDSDTIMLKELSVISERTNIENTQKVKNITKSESLNKKPVSEKIKTKNLQKVKNTVSKPKPLKEKSAMKVMKTARTKQIPKRNAQSRKEIPEDDHDKKIKVSVHLNEKTNEYTCEDYPNACYSLKRNHPIVSIECLNYRPSVSDTKNVIKKPKNKSMVKEVSVVSEKLKFENFQVNSDIYLSEKEIGVKNVSSQLKKEENCAMKTKELFKNGYDDDDYSSEEEISSFSKFEKVDSIQNKLPKFTHEIKDSVYRYKSSATSSIVEPIHSSISIGSVIKDRQSQRNILETPAWLKDYTSSNELVSEHETEASDENVETDNDKQSWCVLA